MYIMTPVLKTSRRLLLWNIFRYTFPNKAVVQFNNNMEELRKIIESINKEKSLVNKTKNYLKLVQPFKEAITDTWFKFQLQKMFYAIK